MMAQGNKEYGIVGCGQMGRNLARQALRKGMRVVGHVRSPAPLELLEAGIVQIESFADFKTNLTHRRAVFIHMPAGSEIDEILDELALHLDPGDVVVDGGNSYWGDSIRRHHRLKQERGIHLVDLGTSGGVEGALYGACFMVGGEREEIAIVEPILKELAIPGGYLHAGPPGAGHFTQLVHKGIEFGMLQAIGEGIDLLEHYRDRLDIASVLRCWCHGSEIRSWLLDLLEEAYDVTGGMSEIPALLRSSDRREPPLGLRAAIEDTGELSWLVNDAIKMEVSVPVISQAMMQMFALRDNKKYWVRAIATILHELNEC